MPEILCAYVPLKDDKELLAELHQVLRGDLATAVPRDRSLDEKDDAARPTPSGHPIPPGHDRLCSLPARTSIISLDSEYSIGTQPMPDATSFQQRRKRAAKLTHFFGVDYRELFDDVLDRIESNMQLGQRDGRLHAAEAEVSCLAFVLYIGGLTVGSGSPSEARQIEI